MMRMLEAGGLPILSDGARTADVDNPDGYYEFERVKQLPDDASWLNQAEGKAVKVISELLTCLPPTHRYNVIFMRRNIEEIMTSQQVMMEHRGTEADSDDDEATRTALTQHLEKVSSWLRQQAHMDALFCDYNRLLGKPSREARVVARFLEPGLNWKKMAAVVDPTLYRQRA